MFRSRRIAFAPASVCSLVMRICVAGAIAAGSAGCASKHAAHTPQRVAGPLPSADDRYWRVEIEEDGLPAQLAPKHRTSFPDDPREPWSPNYGGEGIKRNSAGTMAVERAPVGDAVKPPHRDEPAPQPRRLPSEASARPKAATRTAAFDEEALIRRAIAEHEMRRPD